jgi:hypothetical protein
MLATAWFDGAKLAGRALTNKAGAAGQLRGSDNHPSDIGGYPKLNESHSTQQWALRKIIFAAAHMPADALIRQGTIPAI